MLNAEVSSQNEATIEDFIQIKSILSEEFGQISAKLEAFKAKVQSYIDSKTLHHTIDEYLKHAMIDVDGFNSII